MSADRPRSLATVVDGLAFPEGPRWHRGALWFSDFFTRGVYRAAPDSATELVCEVPGRPSGLGFDQQGRLLVVSMSDRRVLRLQGGDLVEHADLSGIAPADLNDMVVAADGGAYVGNLSRNAPLGAELPPVPLIYVDPDGRARAVGDELFIPNGAVIADDGKTLLVAETLAARITAFTIQSDGGLTDRRVWAQLGPEPETRALFEAMRSGPVPDGIALDAEGALWVADAAGRGALRVADGGEILDLVEVPGFCVYAVALGGSDLRTLFMCVAPPLATYWPELESSETETEAGDGGRQASVRSCRVAVPGRPG